MEFNYLKTGMMSFMAVGTLVFSASMMAAAPESVVPQEGTQETLEDFTLVFKEGAQVAWNVTGTENTPYLSLNGEPCAYAAPFNIAADGNQLSVNFGREFTRAGEYQLNIVAGSYTVDGVAGDACQYKWDVSGILLGYSVEPAVNTLTEIQNIKITFNDNDAVTVAEELGTENSPKVFLVNEEGQREGRGILYLEGVGNNLLLHTYSDPITDPGEYVVVVPGSCYFLDGKPGEDIELHYTIVEPSYPEVELSVNPATDVVETLEDIEITFGGVDVVEWAVTGTENAPYMVDMEGNRMATFSKLGGLGNMLSFGFYDEFAKKGEYKIIIPEGAYVFQGIYHGLPGKQIELTFKVLGLSGYSVEPAVDTLTELQFFRITFHEADAVTVAEELGTENSPKVYLVNEEGQRESRGVLYLEGVGNTLLMHTYSDPITDPGEYVIVLPGSAYFLDGNPGENIELFYKVVEPSYPEVDLSVNPATDVVETLEDIEITFGGVDVVEWAVTGTETAPYMVDMEGNRVATFSKLGGFGNMLSLGFYDEFTKKGEYKVVIPEGAYVFQGVYRGMPGKQIELTFKVLGLGGYTVEPAVNTLTELQFFRITFNDAEEVTVAEELGTENSPKVYLVNEEGQRESRGVLYLEGVGNTLLMHTYSDPITEPGEYVIELPGSAYFLDGNPGENIELIYTVVEDFELKYTVEPAAGNQDALNTIVITFDNCEEAAWNMEAIEADPSLYPSIVSGDKLNESLTSLNAIGNALYLGPDSPDAWSEAGVYVVTVPAGSYSVDGNEGEEIVLNYILSGLSGVDVVFGGKSGFDVYDINGRVILRNADSKDLKGIRGIFVVDGKKYILH